MESFPSSGEGCVGKLEPGAIARLNSTTSWFSRAACKNQTYRLVSLQPAPTSSRGSCTLVSHELTPRHNGTPSKTNPLTSSPRKSPLQEFLKSTCLDCLMLSHPVFASGAFIIRCHSKITLFTSSYSMPLIASPHLNQTIWFYTCLSSTTDLPVSSL